MKRRVNKYIEARKRQNGRLALNAFTQMGYLLEPELLWQMMGGNAQGQQEQTPLMQNGGITKHQSKLISSNSMSGRKFYQSNPELAKLYNEERKRQENEWLNKYYSNQGKLTGNNEGAENADFYGYIPVNLGLDPEKLQDQKPKQIAFDAYNGYALGNYSIPEYKDVLYKSVDDGDIRKSKANRISKNLDRYYENEQDKLNDEAWRNAATILSDKVDVFANDTADRKDYEGLGNFGLAASLAPAILAAGYSLPAILDTGKTALGFLGSPLSTTVQGVTNLVPSLAQYSWLQPSLFAGGIGTALTSCSSPDVHKKEEKKKEEMNKDSTTSNKFLTNDNWENELMKFQRNFEGYTDKAKYILDADKKDSTLTVGYGTTRYWNPDGTFRPLEYKEHLSPEESIEQQRRAIEFDAIPFCKNNLGLKHFNQYPPELKFHLIDAAYNVKRTSLQNKSPNWRNALKIYEDSAYYSNPDYDVSLILRLGDWNKNTKSKYGTPSSIAVRSVMRSNPNSIDTTHYKDVLTKDKWQELYDYYSK